MTDSDNAPLGWRERVQLWVPVIECAGKLALLCGTGYYFYWLTTGRAG